MKARTQQFLVIAGLALAAAAPAAADAQAFRRGGGAAGFTSNTLDRNDDESTGPVNIGFTVNFGSQSWGQLFVNNNGNVTFGSPLSTFTPSALNAPTARPIIAAFFADVDTRNPASAVTQYGMGTVDGRAAFGVNWDGVGYYNSQADKLNIFQLILIDRNDTGAGNFDIEFNYDRILWETGSASGGINGFGGTSAAVGYSQGSGTPGTFAQLPGSLVNGALIDNGPNALVAGSLGSNVLGRYVLNVRGGRRDRAAPDERGSRARDLRDARHRPRRVLVAARRRRTQA
jgi:hypothetical protein